MATLDELPQAGLNEAQMLAFIGELLDYTQRHGVVRLFYFHPASAPDFMATLGRLQPVGQRLQADGAWRWYGMSALAQFLQRRQTVQWSLRPTATGEPASLSAHSPLGLEGMAWVFPPGTGQGLHLSEGRADIIALPNGGWRVVAGECHSLTLHWQRLSARVPENTETAEKPA